MKKMKIYLSVLLVVLLTQSAIAQNPSTVVKDDPLGDFIKHRAHSTQINRQQGGPRTVINSSMYQREVLALAQVLFYETGNRPKREWLAVGNATLNRLNHPEFPNTVYAVISQRGQYQWFHNHRLRGGRVFRPGEHPEIMATAAELYKQHLAGTRHDTTNGAIFFSSNGVRPAPRAVNPQRIGAHVFYRLRPLPRNRNI